MSASQRAMRTAAADELGRLAFAKAACPASRVALVAVGGYGRGALAPGSDLDLVLVYDDGIEPDTWASDLWYPLWDSGHTIDHSVRNQTDLLAQARADLRVALGVLDARHVAGDPAVTLLARTALLAQWRREAAQRLPQLRELSQSRNRRVGELAHDAVPDVKESVGGLRDASVLEALVATWLVDVPHAELARSRQRLLDVRDALHEATGRNSDRIDPEVWPELAATLGLPDALAAQRYVRGAGRRIAHLSRLTWRRAEQVTQRQPGSGARRPQLIPLTTGVAESRGEVVLDAAARVDQDPLLLLRASVAAAEKRLALSPVTASRLARHGAQLPTPWPTEARDLWVRLLAAGPGLAEVWETLEETGALAMLLPEWETVQLLPHSTVVHQFTVDRHMVETCIQAASMLNQVPRPDLLIVAALLHDIGKGEPGDHSAVGAPLARDIATRMGFDEDDAERIAGLVRWHLLLSETATLRDLGDPVTITSVADQVGSVDVLDLLLALTQADARATAPAAWTRWRAGLVHQLAAAVRAVLEGRPADAVAAGEEGLPAGISDPGEDVVVRVADDGDASTVIVAARDRVGLLGDVAAMLALQRSRVRAARVWTVDDVAISAWEVEDTELDPGVLRQRLLRIVAGEIDPTTRLRQRGGLCREPIVVVRPEASRSATVIEVRADDQQGLIQTVAAALAQCRIVIRSAHASTVGPAAIDVFYVQEEHAGALSDERAASAAHALRQALTGAT